MKEFDEDKIIDLGLNNNLLINSMLLLIMRPRHVN
jgi:hypothetical protein